MLSRSLTTLLFATMFPQIAVAMISLAPPVVADQIIAEFGLSPAAIGAYTGVIYTFIFASNLASPQLVGAFGALRLSFGCIVVGGISLAAFAHSPLIAAALATVVIGLSYGPLTPATSYALVSRSGSSGFNLLVSIRQTSVPMGGLLAGLVMPYLTLLYGWRAALTIVGIVLAIAGVLFAFAVKSVREDRPAEGFERGRGVLEPFLFILHRPRLFKLAAASLVFGAQQLILGSFTVIYLVSDLKVDHVMAGIFLGVTQVAGIFARIFWGYIADRMTHPRTLLAAISLGMAASCLSMAALSESTLPVVMGLAMILFGGTASGWNGVFLAEMMREVGPRDAGLATSGGLIFVYLGIIFTPPLFGLAVTSYGFRPSYVGLATLAAIAAALCFERRAPAPGG